MGKRWGSPIQCLYPTTWAAGAPFWNGGADDFEDIPEANVTPAFMRRGRQNTAVGSEVDNSYGAAL